MTARYLICYPDVHETEFDHHCTDLGIPFASVDVTVHIKQLLALGAFQGHANLKAYIGGCPQYGRSSVIFNS